MTDAPAKKDGRVILSSLKYWAARHERLLNNLFSLVLIQFVVALVGFVTRVKIANALGRETFGDFAFATAVGVYGLMFIQYGLEKSLVRELVHFPKRFGELLKASLVLKSVLFCVFLLFLLIAIVLLLHQPGYSWGMVPVILATALTAFQLQGVYDAWREMRRHAIFFMVERCAYFALVWCAILAPFLNLSLGMIGIFLMISVVIGLFFQYHWALPRIEFAAVEGLRSSTVFIMRSNFWIWLAVLSGLSIDYLGQIILKLHAGSLELGGYSAALTIAQLGTLFLGQVGRIGLEATARHTLPGKSARERMGFLLKYAALMAAMGFLIGLPCLLFPRYLLTIFRPEYADVAGTLRLFGLYPLFYGPFLAVLQYVISSRMQKTYFTLITAAGLLSIGLNLWLIPQMQSTGAAISIIVSFATALILFAVVIAFHLKSPTLIVGFDTVGTK